MFINFNLMKQPLNWLIVPLMAMIFLVAIEFALSQVHNPHTESE